MGMTGISKSQVSRLCGEIDGKITAFLDRPLEGEWPYVWLDATYVKARRDGHRRGVASGPSPTRRSTVRLRRIAAVRETAMKPPGSTHDALDWIDVIGGSCPV